MDDRDRVTTADHLKRLEELRDEIALIRRHFEAVRRVGEEEATAKARSLPDTSES